MDKLLSCCPVADEVAVSDIDGIRDKDQNTSAHGKEADDDQNPDDFSHPFTRAKQVRMNCTVWGLRIQDNSEGAVAIWYRKKQPQNPARIFLRRWTSPSFGR